MLGVVKEHAQLVTTEPGAGLPTATRFSLTSTVAQTLAFGRYHPLTMYSSKSAVPRSWSLSDCSNICGKVCRQFTTLLGSRCSVSAVATGTVRSALCSVRCRTIFSTVDYNVINWLVWHHGCPGCSTASYSATTLCGINAGDRFLSHAACLVINV